MKLLLKTILFVVRYELVFGTIYFIFMNLYSNVNFLKNEEQHECYLFYLMKKYKYKLTYHR